MCLTTITRRTATLSKTEDTVAKLSLVYPIPAGTNIDVLQDWQWQIPPRAGQVRLLAWTTAPGLTHELTSLDRVIYQKSAVSAGAAANVLPSEQYVDPVIERVPANQKMQLNVNNSTGGTLNYAFTIDYVPGGK